MQSRSCRAYRNEASFTIEVHLNASVFTHVHRRESEAWGLSTGPAGRTSVGVGGGG